MKVVLLKIWAALKKVPWWVYAILATLLSLGAWYIERRGHRRTKRELASERQATEDQKVRADAAEERIRRDIAEDTAYRERLEAEKRKLETELGELSEQFERGEQLEAEVIDAHGDLEKTLAVLRKVLAEPAP